MTENIQDDLKALVEVFALLRQWREDLKERDFGVEAEDADKMAAVH